MRSLPPLSALPAFEATARLGSMTAAADELGRTHSAISKQIAQLESALGRTLFRRESRGLSLTADGHALFDASTKALGELEGVMADFAAARDTGPLVLQLSSALAARWLLPLLGSNPERPDVGLQLSVGAPRISAAPFEGIDMVLTWDRLVASVDEMVASFHPGALVDVVDDAHIGPVMRSAEDGERRRFVSVGRLDTWRRWSELTGHPVPLSESKTHSLPNLTLAVEGAIAGLGMTMVERRIVAAELADGRLIAPYGFLAIPDGMVIISRGDRTKNARQFITWLKSVARR